MESIEDRSRFFSSLAVVEVRSAIRRRESLGEIHRDDAAVALSLLDDEARRAVQVPITASVLRFAMDAVDTFQLRALDAIQLGTAVDVREAQPEIEIVFLSADNRLLDAAQKAGFETVNALLDKP